MLDIHNTTPFEVALFPTADEEGNEHANIVVKATYSLKQGVESLPIADEQAPIVWADMFHGDDPAVSSVKYQSDICPTKPATDVVLIGHAYAAKGKTASMDVGLRIGRAEKVVRVFGERWWLTGTAGWAVTQPVAFDKMPLVYERAFGGKDESDPKREKHAVDERNPVGTGFCVSGAKERLERLKLPNIEDPQSPISSWKDRPPVAGFGFLSRSWVPRRELAGTYDAKWQNDRAPLLPADFNARYFNGAPKELTITPHLTGGEYVRAIGVSPSGAVSFKLPQPKLLLSLRIQGKAMDPALVLDTVVIEPDEQRVVETWKTTVDCTRKFLFVDRIVVRGT